VVAIELLLETAANPAVGQGSSNHRCIQDGLKEEEDEERAPPRKEHENNNWYPLSYFWRGYLDL
jgi:hypothetical protein